MKLFIKDILNSKKLLSNIKQKKMEKYLSEKENVIDIYSKEGIYQIDSNNTYKLIIKSEEVEQKMINNIEYLIDKSVVEKKQVFQIPTDHVKMPLIILKYSLNNNSPCKLIVECLDNNNKSNNTNTTSEINYDTLKPINSYFEINSNIENDILNFMQDSNVFLSMLN